MVVELFAPQLVRNGAPACTLCGGKAMNGLNCTCASERMWLYRASQGRLNVPTCHIRDLTGDCVGGTNLGQMQAVSTTYGITTGKLYQPIDVTQVFAWIDTGRYGAHLNISYQPVAGSPYDAFAGQFRGNHDVFLSNRGTTSGAIRVGDPGASGFRDWPKTLLAQAAGLLDMGGGATLNDEAGRGKCYAYLTPIDPATPTTRYRVTFICRTTLYASAGGAPAGTVTSASYGARRTLHDGLWWYQIIAPGSANNGKWFKPNRCAKITAA